MSQTQRKAAAQQSGWHRFTPPKGRQPKPPEVRGDSWWVGLSRADLAEEVARRTAERVNRQSAVVYPD